MRRIPLPPIDFLAQCFTVRGDLLHWKARPREYFKSDGDWHGWNARHAGRPAGRLDPRGYVRVHLMGRHYWAHRIGYALANDCDPGTAEVDHRDHCPGADRWVNLRAASRKDNARHRRGPQANNKSGIRGVSLHTQSGRWRAAVYLDGASVRRVSWHATKEEAAAAAEALRARYFGSFAGRG